MQTISLDTYKKKVKGCYVGKAIGGTLGMPMEGYIGTRQMTYYDPVPNGMLANDDLDNQVVWLEVIKRHGLPVNRYWLGKGFANHLLCVMDEYTACVRNINNGVNPPTSGYYDNKFTEGMGSSIRTEIWACLAPGDPFLAAKLAREDACIDHAGAGVDSSMFIAALESQAFLESDPWKLIETALTVIRPESKFSKAIISVMEWVKEGKSLLEIREQILKHYYNQNWTNVCINVSFVVLCLLKSDGNANKGICDVAGLGHDADCTCATLGSIFGIIDPDGFDDRWLKPLGDDLVLSSSMSSLHETRTITEFCAEIACIAPEVLDFYNATSRIDGVENRSTLIHWAENDQNLSLCNDYDELESTVALLPITVKMRYPQSIAMAPGESAMYRVNLSHPFGKITKIKIHLQVPNGWHVSPNDFEISLRDHENQEIEFMITAPLYDRRRRAKNPLDFHVTADGLSYCVSAGLLQTIDFAYSQFDGSPEKAGQVSFDTFSQVIHATAHYFSVPHKKQVFTAEFRSPVYMPEVIMAVQSLSAIKVWIDGELALEHDGGEYVPAFHRSEYVKRFSLNDQWHRLTVWMDEKDYDGTEPEKNPMNAIVRVPNSMTMREYRKQYDPFVKTRQGELFIGFADRAGYRWLDNIEWRLPSEVVQEKKR